jgi:hypothetical protein
MTRNICNLLRISISCTTIPDLETCALIECARRHCVKLRSSPAIFSQVLRSIISIPTVQNSMSTRRNISVFVCVRQSPPELERGCSGEHCPSPTLFLRFCCRFPLASGSCLRHFEYPSFLSSFLSSVNTLTNSLRNSGKVARLNGNNQSYQ